MTEVAFYHLTRSSLEETLPKLLEKTLAAQKRALVLTNSDTRVESLNKALWAYEASSWLPHGSEPDGRADQHPVWLTDAMENPNEASFVFLLDGVLLDGGGGLDLNTFERCFEVFDGTSDEAVKTARKHWKSYSDSGFDLTYWQQNPAGNWQKK